MSDRFTTTRWSLVIAAGDSQNVRSREALADLCRIYWPAVYSYARRRGQSVEAAQDLTQGFFARLLEKQDIKQARRDRGRFRSFLLTAVKHFMANEWDRVQAQKRGGGKVLVPLDLQDAETRYFPEPSHDETPEKLFEKRWALALLDRALQRLEQEMQRDGQAQRFELFKPLLTTGGPAVPYRRLAEILEIKESAVKVAVHRMRKRFGALLRDEVRQTVDDESAADDELRHLFDVLGS